MVGGILTGSTYTGSNSKDWGSGLSDRWTVTAGVELMRLGRNFGIGTGIHYSTYEDRLQVDERTLSNTVIMDSSYFQANTVALLYIIGNVQIGGQEYYVTETRDTVSGADATRGSSTSRALSGRSARIQAMPL